MRKENHLDLSQETGLGQHDDLVIGGVSIHPIKRMPHMGI